MLNLKVFPVLSNQLIVWCGMCTFQRTRFSYLAASETCCDGRNGLCQTFFVFSDENNNNQKYIVCFVLKHFPVTLTDSIVLPQIQCHRRAVYFFFFSLSPYLSFCSLLFAVCTILNKTFKLLLFIQSSFICARRAHRCWFPYSVCWFQFVLLIYMLPAECIFQNGTRQQRNALNAHVAN